MVVRQHYPECPVCDQRFDAGKVEQLQDHINEHTARELLENISPSEYLSDESECIR